MRDLVILGAGVHAIEMVEIIERINQAQPTWTLRGYLADERGRVGEMLNGYPVLAGIDDREDFPEACFVPDNDHQQVPVSIDRLATIIDPSTFVSRTARIGAGCVIYPGGFIGVNAAIGNRVLCLSRCVINHDDVLEDHVILASGVTLAGAVHVETGCYLGQACTVRQQLRIGHHSTIGMGAVVVKEVLPESVMVGNPARNIRENR